MPSRRSSATPCARSCRSAPTRRTRRSATRSSPAHPQTRDAILQVTHGDARRARRAALRPHPRAHRSPRGARGRLSSRRSSPRASRRRRRLGRRAQEACCERGEWWAPLRTARLRTAAAAALRACGSAAAQQALEEAVAEGPRGVRRAAKAALSCAGDARARPEGAADGSRVACASPKTPSGVWRPPCAAHSSTPRGIRSSAADSRRCREAVVQLLADQPSVAIGFIDQEIVVGDTPLPRAAENYGELLRRLQARRHRAHRVRARRDARQNLNTLVLTLAHPELKPGTTSVGDPAVRSRIDRCSRCRTSASAASASTSASTPRRPTSPRFGASYSDAVSSRKLAVGHGRSRRDSPTRTTPASSSTTSRRRSRRIAPRSSR